MMEVGAHKLIEPRWMGIKGAFATKSPSGANRAHEKSRRSLILVLMDVCCRDRPIASATLINLFAKSVSRMGSGPLAGLLREIGVSVIPKVSLVGDAL